MIDTSAIQRVMSSIEIQEIQFTKNPNSKDMKLVIITDEKILTAKRVALTSLGFEECALLDTPPEISVKGILLPHKIGRAHV